jgi:hypothetical protein
MKKKLKIYMLYLVSPFAKHQSLPTVMSTSSFPPAIVAGSNATHQRVVIEPEVVAHVCQCPGPYQGCPFSDTCPCERYRCANCDYRAGFSRMSLEMVFDDMFTHENYISADAVASYRLREADVEAAGDSGC